MTDTRIPSPLEVFEALVEGDEFFFYRRLPQFQNKGWHKCPLCGYTTNATNIHRSCPLAPIDPSQPLRGGLYGRTMSLPMYPVESPEDGRVKHPRTIPDWEDRWHTDPEEWIDTIRDFLSTEKELMKKS